MKLETLSLKAFGPFTDRVLELNPKASLHLIYGPNESGKSSSLRALKTLLYGFPYRTTDNFLHPSAKLQVGGTFRRDGETLEFVRWKKKNRDITDPSGEHDLSDLLQRCLGGLKPEMFDRLYGISHNELVSGGRALLELGGKVGDSLFTASLGPEYHNLADKLKEEYEQLWSSRPSNRSLNVAIRKWEEAQAESSELALSGEAWSKVQSDWDKARAKSRELKDKLLQLNAQLERKERFHKATQDIIRRGEVLATLDSYSKVPQLPTEFSARASEARAEEEAARHRFQHTEQRLQQLLQELEKLPASSPIIQLSERIEALYKRVSKMTENVLQLPTIRGELNSSRSRVSSFLERLGGSSQDQSTPTTTWRTRARELAKEFARIQVELEGLDRRHQELATNLALETGQSASTCLQELPNLELALQMARRSQGLDDKLDVLNKDIRVGRSRLELELSKLPCWSGDIEQLAGALVPSMASVEEHERHLSDTQAWVKDMADAHKQASQKLEELRRQVAELEADGDLVSSQDLALVRCRRDELWNELYHCWLSGEAPETEAELVGDFQTSLRESDSLADRLLNHGERVALYEQLRSQLETAEQEVSHSQQLVVKAKDALKERKDAWLALWEESGVLVESPRQMMTWLNQRRELIEAHKRSAHREKERDQAKLRVEQELRSLAEATAALELPEFQSERGLLGAIEMVDVALRALREEKSQLDTLSQRQADLNAQKRTLTQRKEELQKELDAWNKRWQKHIGDFPYGSKPEPSTLEETLVILEQLTAELERERQLAEQAEQLDRELQVFNDESILLREYLPGSSPEEEPVRVVELAHSAQLRALKVEEERERLESEIQQLRTSKPLLEGELKKSEAALGSVLEEAGVTSVEQLAEAVSRGAQKRELTKELALTEQAIRKFAGSATLEDFCSAHSELDLDTLSAEIGALKEETEELTESRDESLQLAGQLKQKLESLDGTSRSARLNQEAQLAEAEGRELLERYARLVLAERLLRDTIEQFRKDNEGPILEVASSYFEQLTNGAYTRLQTGYDGNNVDPVLFAISKTEREVLVEGLSDGTCDQLFLALRLATIAKSAKTSQTLPVIADDILVQFDDLRARSTLNALAEFSSVTQVVLFTHLERDFELAKSMKDSRIDLIRLPELNL